MIRIAMWSGPRNISTAMMRAFENRGDCAVVDEPLYAAYLADTGADHPLRDAVLASQPQDWRAVVHTLTETDPGTPLQYQKHMAHHLRPGFGRDWVARCRNAFLIRDPAQVLASYGAVRGQATLDDIGAVEQHDLFRAECDRLGHAPPVIDAADVLARPAHMLQRLCTALGIPFTERMLTWPPGPRDSDGAWGPAWYASVERSTGFASAPPPAPRPLTAGAAAVLARAQPLYAALYDHRLR